MGLLQMTEFFQMRVDLWPNLVKFPVLPTYRRGGEPARLDFAHVGAACGWQAAVNLGWPSLPFAECMLYIDKDMTAKPYH